MKRILKIFTMFLLLLVIPALVIAAGGHGEGGSNSAAEWKDFFWRCVNFALFAGIIYKLAGSKIKNFFGSRTEQIQQKFASLESRKQEAEKRLKEVEARIANLEAERQAILEEAKKQGEAIKNSIIEKAKKDAEEIKKQAEIKAKQEFDQALEAIKAEMADKIIESAEKIILSRLGVKEQEGLIDKYLTKVVLN